MSSNIYVVPDANGWRVRRGEDVLATHPTKLDAVIAGIALARKHNCAFIVLNEHGEDVTDEPIGDP